MKGATSGIHDDRTQVHISIRDGAGVETTAHLEARQNSEGTKHAVLGGDNGGPSLSEAGGEKTQRKQEDLEAFQTPPEESGEVIGKERAKSRGCSLVRKLFSSY